MDLNEISTPDEDLTQSLIHVGGVWTKPPPTSSENSDEPGVYSETQEFTVKLVTSLYITLIGQLVIIQQ